jgi:hypothetical protein
MSILAKHLELVKGQADFHRGMVDKLRGSPWRSKLHAETAGAMAALLADLETADRELDSPSARAVKTARGAPLQLSLNIEDVAGLPEELIQELNLTEGDKTEFAILNAVEENGGVISLDRLLIALYKKTGEIHKRPTLTSRIYRMTTKSLLYNVPGKKGVYSNEPLTSEDVAKLFGTVKDAA